VPDLWIDLLGCLDLHGGTDEGFDGKDVTTFDGASQQLQYHRVFGGQLLGQFVRAAQLTSPDKTVKSLHAVEDGPEHQEPEHVPALLDEKHRAELGLIPWETRCAEDLNAIAAGPPRSEVWMRTPAVDIDPAPALTAYATDLTLIGTALRPLEGFNHSGNGTLFTSAVTSHTVWFHRPFRTDHWLLLRQHSPVLAHGRCFGRGDVLTEDGTLVASYAQEALLRFRDCAESDTA